MFRRKHLSFAATLLSFAACLVAQERRPLTHDDYDQWKSLRATAYSLDGNWVAFQIEPQWGDGVLEIRETTGTKKYRHDFASAPRFTADGRYVVFTVGKSKVEERDKKIEELRKKAKEGNKPASEETREGEGEEGVRRPPSAGAAPAGPPGGFARGGGRRGGGGPGAGGGGPGAGGPGGGGPGGAGGEESSRERGELVVLELATGKIEKLGKVKGTTVSDDVPFLLYHKDKPEPKPENGDKKLESGEGKGEPAKEPAPAGEPAAEPKEPGKEPTAEPKEPQPAEPQPNQPAAKEPGAEPEPKEPHAAEQPRREGGGPGARRGGGRRNGPPADPMEAKRPEGTELVVRDLQSGHERSIADVVAYGLSRNGKLLWYHTSAKKPAKDGKYGLFVQQLAGGEPVQVLDGVAHVGNVTIDRGEKTIAFTSDKEDFAADKPASDLYVWDGSNTPARRIAWAGGPGMPVGKRVAGGVSFSRDGSMLAFEVNDAPAPDPLPILPEDKVTLDIWNWRDGTLQTAQQKRGNNERNPEWTALYDRAKDRVAVLGDDGLRSLRFLGPDGKKLIGNDGRAYDKETTWDGRYNDVWLVDSSSGERTRVHERLRGSVSSSPNGTWLIWFGPDYHWWSQEVATGTRRDLTGALGVPFHHYDDDHPEPDSPYGLAGWTENDAAVLVYDEFDVWKVSPSTGNAVCITDGYGREHRLRLRIQPLRRDDDRPWVDDELLLSATDVDTMAEGFFADSVQRTQRPQKLVLADRNFGDVTRPKKGSRLFFTQGTFAEFPDLWTSASDFTDMRRLSDANPQQKNYRWGKAEIVHWIDGDGGKRQGVLIRPDDFDPTKKYPMLVSFYERMTQSLHNYVAPAPGTSPNASYYVSNGYLWFEPDVVYEIGYPGTSCVKCVVSGVQHLIAQGFVDEKAIGAAGHSWGGYQTAFLVTRTNIFAAVESGAPVSNMLSAYGGIRYESGVSRQFQYEMTQSRIGGTPWQYPLRYQENSPIWFADKVRTPVLIMANDQDGAVPWTQGIEYFTALRRLGKECYLFNYNGEGHGLRNRANMKDWTRRMAEYFAHHLRKEPAPKWMSEGVPYFDRDNEKLPFAQSYIDAHVKQPPAPKAAPAAPAAAPSAEPVAKAEPDTKSEPAAKTEVAAKTEGAAKPEAAANGNTHGANGNGNGSGAALAAKPADEPKADPSRGSQPREAAAAVAAPAKLTRGEPAPDFAIADETGTIRKLADFRGKKVLVWFYPKADTPGCTKEGCGLRDQHADFERQNVVVLGVSLDTPADNASFRQKHGLPFPLLCDVDRTMSVAYGAADDTHARFARRIAVLIDGDGKVMQVWTKVDPATFASTALAALPQ